MYSRHVPGIFLKSYHSNTSRSVFDNTRYFMNFSQRYGVHISERLRLCRFRMSFWLKEQSIQVVKACTRQCEFIVAQRIRRTVQIFHLYSRIWDEVALKEFINCWKRKFANGSRHFLLGGTGISLYNWKAERIKDKEMYRYVHEIEKVHNLRDSTVVCKECDSRLIIDHKITNIDYCECNTKTACNSDNEEWKPFIEREDMLIWRKEEDNSGLYVYKVYGSFADVSAKDFLEVQLDTEYRKEWDATAKELKIIDSDNIWSKESQNSRSDVIYWEMIWPRFFMNRDYIYKRRWLHDKERNVIIIVSKETDHPNAPSNPDAYRVTRYWSYMVIKPYKDFDEPGLEFVLTYFDDPGINIPAAVTTWVALSGLPDYLCRMRQAVRDYKNYILKKHLNDSEEQINYTNTDNLNYENIDENRVVEEDISHESENERNIDHNVKSDDPPESSKTKSGDSSNNNEDSKESPSENEAIQNETDDKEDEDEKFFDYFYLAKLFV